MTEFWRFTDPPTEFYTVIEGDYNYLLVCLSFLISCLSAYALFVVLERAWQSISSKALMLWKLFGSIVFGLGVWAMHFTGMLGFMLPVSMSFDVSLTILSVFAPMIGAYFSLQRLSIENFSFFSIQISALFLALGVGSMHYLGMEAMNTEAIMSYNFSLFIASIVVAHLLATIAIYLIKHFNSSKKVSFFAKIPGAISMGTAVGCMHYVAMRAASFHINSATEIETISMNGNAIAFSLAITGIVFIIVATTILCALIEEKLQRAEVTAEESVIREKEIVEHMADGLLTMNAFGVIESINSAGSRMFGSTQDVLVGSNISALMTADRLQTFDDASLQKIVGKTFTAQGVKSDGSVFPIEVNFSRMSLMSLNQIVFNCVARDITERVQLEEQLRQAQKLESIGQLSAGIAHEINTPTQYVSDNAVFLKTAFDSCVQIISSVKTLLDKDASDISKKELDEIRSAFIEHDMDFVLSEIPPAISQSIEGLERIKNIVGAMKSFSHSDQGEMSAVDLVEAIDSTITVSRSEWRYLANLSTDYATDIPKIMCHRDEFNQVILNLIVNAAHAIEQKYGKDSEQLGNIKITVKKISDNIQVAISDDGIGMNQLTKTRIFDPFFTTKSVGKGTGQGLSMAYSIIVEKHKGKIKVESEENVGSTFTVVIPIS